MGNVTSIVAKGLAERKLKKFEKFGIVDLVSDARTIIKA